MYKYYFKFKNSYTLRNIISFDNQKNKFFIANILNKH